MKGYWVVEEKGVSENSVQIAIMKSLLQCQKDSEIKEQQSIKREAGKFYVNYNENEKTL